MKTLQDFVNLVDTYPAGTEYPLTQEEYDEFLKLCEGQPYLPSYFQRDVDKKPFLMCHDRRLVVKDKFNVITNPAPEFDENGRAIIK